jgi:threonine dehydrogenase-like Zn-dependent dehydrogenase
MEVASEHYPVAVIGSGPIGLTLVNLLGKFGIESLIVERNAARCRSLQQIFLTGIIPALCAGLAVIAGDLPASPRQCAAMPTRA